MTDPTRVLSLGAGVQSTTVALMSAVGDLPKLDAAIFADTQWEPRSVYAHLDWLQPELERAGIPVYRVTAGNIREDALAGVHDGGRFARMPLYVDSPSDRGGVIRRQCTQEYKIEPVRAQIRDMLEIPPRSPGPKRVVCEQWFGISLDEVQRMRDSAVRWMVNRYPLVDLRMTRHDCLRWLETRGYPQPPKSACVGCPYHSDAAWALMRRDDPEAFADAADFDRRIRHLPRIEGDVFLHRSLKPLDEVDLRTREERGEQSFLGECDGMCGV